MSAQSDNATLAERPAIKEPPRYQVLLLNDDYTPMDFVVETLQTFFAMPQDQATRVMLEIHTKGKGRCGEFAFEIAETKVMHVNDYARQHQHPLLCVMEPA